MFSSTIMIRRRGEKRDLFCDGDMGGGGTRTVFRRVRFSFYKEGEKKKEGKKERNLFMRGLCMPQGSGFEERGGGRLMGVLLRLYIAGGEGGEKKAIFLFESAG